MALPKLATFDPGSPARPVLINAMDIDPRVHTRWKYRPAALTVLWNQALATRLEADGDGPAKVVESPVTEAQEAALHAAGVTCLLDVLSAGEGGLRAVDGVGAKTARAILAWAEAHEYKAHAEAELAAKAVDAAKKDEPADGEEAEPDGDAATDGGAESDPGTDGGAEG